jgi:hypothetical protein
MLYTRDGVRDWIHADVIVRSLAATVRETRYIYQSSLISAIQYYQESAVYTYAAFLQLTRPHSNEIFVPCLCTLQAHLVCGAHVSSLGTVWLLESMVKQMG